jgi:hypothetical protein
MECNGYDIQKKVVDYCIKTYALKFLVWFEIIIIFQDKVVYLHNFENSFLFHWNTKCDVLGQF